MTHHIPGTYQEAPPSGPGPSAPKAHRVSPCTDAAGDEASRRTSWKGRPPVTVAEDQQPREGRNQDEQHHPHEPHGTFSPTPSARRPSEGLADSRSARASSGVPP